MTRLPGARPAPAETGSRSAIDLFRGYLRDQGLPITGQRESIAAVVFESDRHLSVDELETELRRNGDRIGKATVYRTLDLLVKSRLVDELDFGEGFKRYESRFHRESMHEHLICQACGKVTEFPTPELPAIEARAAREHGFRPTRHKLEIYGLCASCQEAGVELTPEGIVCPIEIV